MILDDGGDASSRYLPFAYERYTSIHLVVLKAG